MSTGSSGTRCKRYEEDRESLREEEPGMMKPNESIDWMFVRSFCEEDEDFDKDLPVIILDFVVC